jgi:Zn-dependent M28 family amino/carboxypeptidase
MANGLIARRHIVALSETIGPRVAGTPDEATAAEYIEAAFEAYGYVTQLQPFSFTTEDEDEEATLNSANVIAVKTGLSPREIIVGAHYDSVDAGAGADDNASGVAVMLEAAEKIKDIQTPYTIRFIAFGAEEVDLDGSRYYADQMNASDIQNTVGMINLDSLIAGDIAYVYGEAGPAGVVRDWILEFAQSKGFDMETQPGDNLDEPDGTPCDCADYGPFEEAGVPFAYFEATNWNLGEEDGLTQVAPEFGEEGEIRHTEYDTLSYIDGSFPARIAKHLDLFVTLLYDTLTQFKTHS